MKKTIFSVMFVLMVSATSAGAIEEQVRKEIFSTSHGCPLWAYCPEEQMDEEVVSADLTFESKMECSYPPDSCMYYVRCLRSWPPLGCNWDDLKSLPENL